MKLIAHLLLTALAVYVASQIVPGIYVANFGIAILVAFILGILNTTLSLLLKVLTFPLTIVTFGLFLLVINAWMFWLASFIKGFQVSGFWAAFLGSLIVTVVSMAGKRLIRS